MPESDRQRTDDELAAAGMTIAIHARERPNDLALKCANGDTRTWKELNDRSNQLAHALRKAGLRDGDAVALLAHNAAEFVEVWAACQRSGLRLTPINWHQSASIVAYIIDNCDAKALFSSAHFGDLVKDLPATESNVKVRICFAGAMQGYTDFEDFIRNEPKDALPDPSMGSYMLYTSGTTGRPKGVHRPVRPAASQLTATILETAAFQPGKDVTLVTGPLYHAAPLALNLVTPLNAGVCCVLMDKWDAEETLRLVQDERITHTHVVPTMFHRLLQLPEAARQKYDVSSLRWILHGAAPCPVHVKHAIIEWFGPVVYEYYSSTEGGGVFIDSHDWLKRPGSVGRPVAGVAIKLIEADGEEAPANTPATIYIKAPETGRFVYYKDDSKTDSSYRGDYFTLGDMGYVDDEGYLFLTGRSAELIISGGVNIYPAEIDEVLIQHESVADAAAIGVPNDEWGEAIKAVVELKEGVPPTPEMADDILAYAAARLPGFQKPRSVDFVEQLPRSAAGKVLRQQVRDPYWPKR